MERKLDPITIFINDEGYLDVSQNGKRCNGLAYDEMIGQVISLTAHLVRKDGYPMDTPEGWAASRSKINAVTTASDDEPF
jgi:hypothetical protein